MSEGIGVCTCVAGNYVAFARVLADSFHRYHPDIPFHVLVADTPARGETVKGPGVHTVRLEDLGIPGLRRMLIRYNRRQVVVAAKPALISHLLKAGYQTAVYLDADMLVTASLEPVLKEVAGHSLSLTPHVGPAFAEAERADLERILLMAGMYNGGFVGATNCDESRRFLAWWEERLRTHCIESLAEGLHYDQRWLDLAPALVGDLHLLRDPGLNVAYWSLPELDVRSGAEGLLVDGVPLRLFHFSGYNPSQPQQVTCHLADLRVEDTGSAAELFQRYAALLHEAGWDATRGVPWPWDGWRALVRRAAGWKPLLNRKGLFLLAKLVRDRLP